MVTLGEHKVVWLDRCRQTKRLCQGRPRDFTNEVARTLLASFITEQRWGLAMPVANEDGYVREPGVFNFDPSGWTTDYDHPHFLEMCIFGNIVTDVERGEWQHIDYYMRRAEFFHEAAFVSSLRARLRASSPSAAQTPSTHPVRCISGAHGKQ